MEQMKRPHELLLGEDLIYLMCDDWFIYAIESKTGELYCLNTELLGDWLDLPENADQEDDAVEKHILPLVKKDPRRYSFQKEQCVKTTTGCQYYDNYPEERICSDCNDAMTSRCVFFGKIVQDESGRWVAKNA